MSIRHFILMFHRPISYRFREKRRFQSKFTKFSHPLYFVPPRRSSP